MRILALLAIVVLTASCKQTTYTPAATTVVEYTDLTGKIAGPQQPVSLDLNKDGINDIRFSFQLVGDPLAQVDKHQFYVSGGFDTYFPINNDDVFPYIVHNATIATKSFPGYEWYNANAVLLAEKVLSMTQPPLWRGGWYNKSHAYLPFFLLKNGNRYFGWVEFSFDTTTEKVVLHSAAVSKEAEKPVQAGVH